MNDAQTILAAVFEAGYKDEELNALVGAVRLNLVLISLAILLALSFMMALITYGTGRATLLSGVVHLIMLATWLFLIVVP